MPPIARERLKRTVLEDSRYVFEPIIRLEDRSILGYEALLRLSGDADFSTANQLFATCHRLRAAREIDAITSQKAIDEFADIPSAADSVLFYNLHNPALTEREPQSPHPTPVQRRANSGGGPVCIEVSEQAPLSEDGFLRYLQEWPERPLVALDDFGTGHSGIARLVALQPDFVKIDRMFVHRIAEDGKVASRLARIVDLIHDSDAEVIVEGVETETALSRCREAGCDYAQGFLFGSALQSPQAA